MLRARPDVLIVVVGDPIVRRGLDVAFHNRDYPAHLLAQQPSVDAERLWFLGASTPETVAEVLAASDLHIAPSRSYPVARSLLEAMAAGCVVLASDTEPHREVITPGQTGLLVDGSRHRRPGAAGPGRAGRPGRPPAAGRRRGGAGARAITPGCRAYLGSPSGSRRLAAARGKRP